MRRLFLGPIDGRFDPETAIAIGPWCFRHREHIKTDWDTLPFVATFDRIEEHHAAGEAARGLANFWVDRLWPELNSRHGKNYGRAFWHRLLVNWLLHLIELTWRRYVHVKNFIAAYPDEEFQAELLGSRFEKKIETTFHFIRCALYDNAFNFWITCAITRLLAPAHWAYDELDESWAIIGDAVVAAPPVSSRWRNPVRYVEGMDRLRHPLGAYIHALSRRQPRQRRERTFDPSTYFPQGYLSLLERLVRETMPGSFGDEFGRFDADASRHPFYPGRLYVGHHGSHHDSENFVTAHALDRGERVVSVQHGGGYGYNGITTMIAETEYAHDSFITWGWTEHTEYEGCFVPLPSPALSRVLGKYRKSDDRLILVGTSMRIFTSRIDCWPQPISYRRDKVTFLRALQGNIRSRAAYRPMLLEDAIDDGAFVQRAFPNIEIVEGPLSEQILGCRLLVVDHPGTTISAAFAAGIPTVLYWNKADWPLAAQAKPQFEALERAGILFDSPSAAAAKINAIWDNIDEWWSSAEVVKARRLWSQSHGQASRTWLLSWLRGLAQL